MQSREELAREKIDPRLQQCSWILQNHRTINLSAARGITIREALLKGGDEVDYLLFVHDKATGTVKRNREGFKLTGVQERSDKWGNGLRYTGPKWLEPLPFVHEIEAHDTQKQF